MTIDDVVDLDITFGKLAEERERQAYVSAYIKGWEAAHYDDALLFSKIEVSWHDYKNGK
jgi:hypothetical protein